MPAHVCAADAPEDLWRCHECGWTYPNHHPSAKHRRNHKKQCGKLSGFTRTKDLTSGPQVVSGSSEDGSSEEDHHRSSHQVHEKNGHDQEHAQSPSQVGASNAEQVCENGSNLSSSNDGGYRITPKIHEETALSTRNLNLSHSNEFAELPNGNNLGRSSFRSAHAFKGQWTCRHCGWAYPNAHPSAKNRRKHKKTCGIAAAYAGPGGSSDEASSDDGNGTQESLKCQSSASRGSLGAETINEVSAMDKGLSKDVEGGPTAPQVPSKSVSSNSQVPGGTTRLDAVFGSKEEEKMDLVDSQVTMVDKGNVQAPDEQASNGVEPSDLDRTGIHQQRLNAISEQVDYKNLHLPGPSHQISPREDGDQNINGLEKRNSESAQAQSAVKIGTGSLMDTVGSPELDIKSPQSKSALRAVVRGESLNVEERSSPGSPEGIVRSRVHIFEKLAGTSPQYLRKSVSPKTISGSPRLPNSSHLLNNGISGENITASDSHETPKDLQETIAHLRHHQSSERMAQPASTRGAPSELQEVMSHLRHRGSFVQIECNEAPVERT